MHDNVVLAGPVWLVVQFLVLVAIVLSVFTLADSLRPVRRAGSRDGRPAEPLWIYTALSGAFLLLLLAVQLIPGVQLAAAAVAIATPFVIVLGMVYLLRVVFPKQPAESE